MGAVEYRNRIHDSPARGGSPEAVGSVRLQRVFLEVHRSIGRFEGRSLFTTWLTRVAIHVAHAHERQWRLFDRPRRHVRSQGLALVAPWV